MNIATGRLLLVLAALGWGGATTATKYALGGFGPMTLLEVELLTAAAVLWAVMAVRGFPRVVRKWRLAVLGLFEPTLAYGGLTLGLTYTTATNASLLGASEACFVVAMAAVLLGERVGARSLIGVALAIVGVGFIEHVSAGSGGLNLGDLLVIGGDLAAASNVIIACRLAATVESLAMTSYQFGFSVLFCAPLVGWQWLSGREPLPNHVGAGYWLAAALVGGVGFAGSFLLYNHVIRFVSAGLSGVTLNLIPLFGVLGAVVFLDERLTGWHVLGGATIVAGIMLFPTRRLAVRTRGRHRRVEPQPMWW